MKELVALAGKIFVKAPAPIAICQPVTVPVKFDRDIVAVLVENGAGQTSFTGAGSPAIAIVPLLGTG